MSRDSVSAGPPGGTATIRRIGFTGYAADAGPIATANNANVIAAVHLLMMLLLFLWYAASRQAAVKQAAPRSLAQHLRFSLSFFIIASRPLLRDTRAQCYDGSGNQEAPHV